MKKIITPVILFLMAALVAFGSISCINTKSPDMRVVFFLNMIKSENFNDARALIDREPFIKTILEKVLALPDEAIVSILKKSSVPDPAKQNFPATDEVKMKELKSMIESVMLKDPGTLDTTFREMSQHLKNKDIDVTAQTIGDTTGEVYIRLSEPEKHFETIIFFLSKKNEEWLISGMREVISGWLF